MHFMEAIPIFISGVLSFSIQTGSTPIPMPSGLGVVHALAHHVGTLTMRTFPAFGPANLA
jgi:hypothetical protein